MEYRQYHNLTEAYLSRVNEDTKQQQLDEVVGLAARGLRAAAPIANKILQGLFGLETAALLSTAVDEFEGEKEPNDPTFGLFDPEGFGIDPEGDMDKDGRKNVVDDDIDGDGVLNNDDDNPYGGFGSKQAGKRIIRVPYAGIAPGVPGGTVTIENPFDPVLRASDAAFLEKPTEGLEYLYNLLADIFEETEKEIGRPLLIEEKQKIIESKQLNEIAPLLIRLAASPLGKSIARGGSALFKQFKPLFGYRGLGYGLAGGVADGGADYIETRDVQAMTDREVEQIKAINDEYFDDDRTMQEQETIDAIFDLIELIGDSNLAWRLADLIGLNTEQELYEWLSTNYYSVTYLYAFLTNLAAQIESSGETTTPDQTEDAIEIRNELMARFPGMTMEEILQMLVAQREQGAETLGDIDL